MLSSAILSSFLICDIVIRVVLVAETEIPDTPIHKDRIFIVIQFISMVLNNNVMIKNRNCMFSEPKPFTEQIKRQTVVCDWDR